MFDLPSRGEASVRETLDPGFRQHSYTNEEMKDVVVFEEKFDQIVETYQETPASFILAEAEKSLFYKTIPSLYT